MPTIRAAVVVTWSQTGRELSIVAAQAAFRPTCSAAAAAIGDRDHRFATPSLRFVGATPPYLHDGRFESIRELLLFAPGPMGRAKKLPPSDVDALTAYVQSL